MYKKKDDIKNLIDTLTNGEKRHFSNHFKPKNNNKEQDNFWAVFESYKNNKSQIPNEEMNSRAVVSAKRLLYNNILKSLRSLHDAASVDIIIQNNLTNVELLYHHNLPDQAILLIDKTLFITRRNEKFGLLLQTLDWEKRINIVSTMPLRNMEHVQMEEQEVIQKMVQMKGLENLHTQIMNLKRQFGYARGAIKTKLEEDIINSSLMPKEQDCLSSKALYYRNLIMAIYCWMTFDHNTAYKHSKSLVSFDGNKIIPNDFISGLLQHITSTVCIADFDGTLKTIELSNAFIRQYKLEHSLPFKILMLTYNSIYQLIVYTYTGNVKQLKKVLKESHSVLENKDLNLMMPNKLIIMGNMMNAYICLDNYDAALTLWNAQFDKRFKNIRLDIYGDLFLSRLFMLLHQQQFELLESALNSAYKFFNKQNKESHQFNLELAITNTLKRHSDTNLNSKIAFKQAVDAVKKCIEDYIYKISPEIKFQEHYTRYVIWCDVLLQAIPFATAAKHWHAQFLINLEN